MNVNNNPFNVRLTDVVITKFNGTDKMSIMPQVFELVIYQSIFSPVIKAQLVIADYINLLNNYPLTGEETVEVYLTQGQYDTPYENENFKVRFVIESVGNITTSASNRELVYTIDLVTEEAFVNAKTKVSHAYKKTIEEMMEDVLRKYLRTNKKFNVFNDTKKIRDLIIPNLRPFAALSWLSKFAISAEPEKYYTHAFYETLSGGGSESFTSTVTLPGYTFKALQRPTYKGLQDQDALTLSRAFPYFYVSNIETIKNNPKLLGPLKERGFTEERSILSVTMNKRFSTLEKILGGYYENEYVEVNMLKKDYKITRTGLDDMKQTLHKGKLSTNDYIKDIISDQVNDETSARTRYVINNYDDLNQPSFRDKFGNSVRSFLAYSQIDLSVGVLTDLTLRPGDVFYAQLPEFHGFNDVVADKYLSGYFLISEIKSVLRPNGETSSVLRINKDSYTNSLFEKSLYNQGDGGTNVDKRSRQEISR